MSVSKHPSFFELDEVALRMVEGTLANHHVLECDRCRAYVESLRRPVPVPCWASARPSRVRWGNRRLWTGGLAAAAILAMAFVGVRSDEGAERYAQVRGEPSVGVYVKHGARVTLWDGHRVIEPGDKLRLKVVPEGFRYVAVFAVSDLDDRIEVLFSGELDPEGEFLLPRAWEVDDQSASETMLVALANYPIQESQVVSDNEGLWVRRLTFRKQIGSRSSD